MPFLSQDSQGDIFQVVVVFMTCPDRATAREIAKKLVNAKLAACANILTGVESLFRWRGAIEEAEEAFLIAKTRGELLDELIEAVEELHPYELPEVIALPVVGGLSRYLAWVRAETKRPKGSGGAAGI